MTPKDLERLLTAVGECTPEVDEIVAAGDDLAWAICLEGDQVVTVERDPETQELRLMANVGQPPQAQRLAVCEALMLWNAMGPMTNGLVLGLTSLGGDLLQSQPLVARDLQAAELSELVLGFADKARVWRRLVTQEHGASANRSDWPNLIANLDRA